MQEQDGQRQQPEALWFLDARLTVRLRRAGGSDGISLLEFEAAQGHGPPLHVHRTEDEVFHVLEGALRVQVGGRELRLGAGEAMRAPRGVPHTFLVESAAGARWLIITSGGDFEAFVLGFARPAEGPGLPPDQGPPTPAQQEALAAACLRHDIELVGPPLQP